MDLESDVDIVIEDLLHESESHQYPSNKAGARMRYYDAAHQIYFVSIFQIFM